MQKERNQWVDALAEQDIPADTVDWARIIAEPDEDELSADAGLLDAEATIGETPPEDEEQ